jgi:uncharacterized membrane protein YccC
MTDEAAAEAERLRARAEELEDQHTTFVMQLQTALGDQHSSPAEMLAAVDRLRARVEELEEIATWVAKQIAPGSGRRSDARAQHPREPK